MVTRGAAQMEDSIPAGPNDGRKGYLFSLFGNPTLPFSTLTQKDSLGPSSNPPPFDPSSTQHSNPQLQEAAPCPGIHCSFREAMLFHKNAKGSLEPGTDPAPPTNWRSPVEAIVTPPPNVHAASAFLSAGRCPSLLTTHLSLTAPITRAPSDRSSGFAKRARHCDPTALRSIPCRRGAPSVDEDGIPGGLVEQDPPCVAFATADVPGPRRLPNPTSDARRTSNTHPESQSTPTD